MINLTVNLSYRNPDTDLLESNPISGGGGDPLFFDNFESGSDGDLMVSRGFIRTNGTVSNVRAASGSKSVKQSLVFDTAADQLYGFARALDSPLTEGEEFWVRTKFFYPNGWDFGNSGNSGLGGSAPRSKFWRLHTRTAEGANKGYNDLYLWKENDSVTRWNWIKEQIDAWAFSGLDGFAPGRPSAPNTRIIRNSWCPVEYYVKLHSSPAQSCVRVWVNNLLEFEINDLATLSLSTDVADEIQFCTYYNGGAPATQDMWVDDVEIYTSDSPPTNTDLSGNIFIGGD